MVYHKALGRVNTNSLYLSNIQGEMEALKTISHPFLVELVRTFKDEDNVYFLMKYIQGRVMHSYINHIGNLNFLEKIYNLFNLVNGR
jgi:cGMP-dependent protein kinase